MSDEQYPPPPSPGRPTPPQPDAEGVWPAHAWYHSWFVILLVLVVCGPVGLVLLWSSPYGTVWKVVVTVATVAVYVVALAIPSGNTLQRYG